LSKKGEWFLGTIISCVQEERCGDERARPLADFAEYAPRSVGNPAIEFPARIAIKSSARRIGSILVHTCKLKSLAVVKGSMAAAMMHGDRMIL